MSKNKRELDFEIISNIDGDIIERNSKRRFDLFTRMSERRKKKRIAVAWISVAASFILIFGILLAVILPMLTKQVPVYQGMTVSKEFPIAQSANAESFMPDFAPVSLSLTEPTYINPYNLSTGNENANGHDKNGKNDLPAPEETVVEQVKDSLGIVGVEKSIYYAEKNKDIFITVHIDNPDSFEILSFTLNGKKYSSYMFEEGSDMENLVLKVNVGDVEGTVEYTIDAIKYIDGTEIKDVKMEGDKTVKVGVATDRQPTAVFREEKIGFDNIFLKLEITDQMKLIELSEGRVDAVLYDGENIIAYQSVDPSSVNEIRFEGLETGKAYTYVVVASYDALDGNGFYTYILANNTVSTLEYLMFDNVSVTHSEVSYSLEWHKESIDGKILSMELYLEDQKIRDISEDIAMIEGLLSGKDYKILVEYENNGKKDALYLSFTTIAKERPEVQLFVSGVDQTSVEFEVTYTDKDNVGSISKIELWYKKGAQTTLVSESDLETEKITGLLSNNNYILKLIYTYDLNDGEGIRTRTVEQSFRTIAKQSPYVDIMAYSTNDHIGFDISVVDEEDTFYEITNIELYKGEEVVRTAASIHERDFDGLEPYTEYTVKVSFTVDMNDGRGIVTRSKKATLYTLPSFTAKEIFVIGADAQIFTGDTVTLSIKIDNPAALMAKTITVNDKKYKVNKSLTTSETVSVDLTVDDSFGEGEISLIVNSIEFEGASENYTYEPVTNNTVKIFVNGEFNVTSIE